MTRIPTESWNIKPRLDLPPYELNKACPLTGEITGLEDHHLFRRSFTALGKEDNDNLYWVELEDGTVIGNRINLSSQAHYRLTVNKARIMYAQYEKLWYWIENEEWIVLKWQPPIWDEQYSQATWPLSREDDIAIAREVVGRDASDTGERMSLEELAASVIHVSEGQECPACHRRVPHKKKQSSPKTKVYSTRVPVDDVETFKELVDAAAEHMGAKSRPHHEYWTLLTGLTLLLQAPKEQLP